MRSPETAISVASTVERSTIQDIRVGGPRRNSRGRLMTDAASAWHCAISTATRPSRDRPALPRHSPASWWRAATLITMAGESFVRLWSTQLPMPRGRNVPAARCPS
jgi:hypothetical protein